MRVLEQQQAQELLSIPYDPNCLNGTSMHVFPLSFHRDEFADALSSSNGRRLQQVGAALYLSSLCRLGCIFWRRRTGVPMENKDNNEYELSGVSMGHGDYSMQRNTHVQHKCQLPAVERTKWRSFKVADREEGSPELREGMREDWEGLERCWGEFEELNTPKRDGKRNGRTGSLHRSPCLLHPRTPLQSFFSASSESNNLG